MSPAPAVRMENVRKSFGTTPALEGVGLDVLPGEIHALLGENGAGKSTLMHLLAGLMQPDAGTIRIGGEAARIRSARDAARLGIGMVHQHFKLVSNFTVAENLALALPEQTPFLWRRGAADSPALQVAERLGWPLPADAPVWTLPVGVQQRLEIVKVLARDPRILIFDEPTAALAPVEVEELFAVLRRLRGEGRSLIFISHKLGEVLRLCDRVTVLRRGRNAGTLAIGDTDEANLAARMVGGETGSTLPVSPARREAGEPMLRIEGLRVRGDRGEEALRGVDLTVGRGEIFGVAGVDGNGQTELAEAVVGLRLPAGGRVLLGDGRPPARARDRLGYVPQDRRRDGLVPGMSVLENLVLELHGEEEGSRGPWLRWATLRDRARAMMERFDVRAAGLDQPVETLSGGNQQKIVLARALQKGPSLLVAVNPTRGVDVGATRYVHERIRDARDAGAAVLLISTELDEIRALSDRVGVLYEGSLLGPVPPETPRETLGLLMGGQDVRVPAA